MKLVYAATILTSALLGSAAAQIVMPPVESGVIDGHAALGVWPAHYAKIGEYELESPKGCRAHFTSTSDLDADQVLPCGQWLRPAPGTYKVWLESPTYVGPVPMLIHYADEGFQGKGHALVYPVVPAGFVTLAKGLRPKDSESLRVLSLESRFLGAPKRSLDVRVRDALALVAMPEGNVLAGLFDRKSGDAISLAPAVRVRAGRTTVISPGSPEKDSSVLAILKRPLTREPDDVRLVLTTDDGGPARAPDVSLYAVDSVFAVWNGITSRHARITARSETVTLAPAEVRLVPKRITTFRGALELAPKLKITMAVPDKSFKTIHLSVRQARSTESVRELDFTDGIPPSVEMTVPAVALHVALTIDDEWTFERDIDLSAGSDQEVLFSLNPLVVTGTVYYGSDRAKAEIAFQTRADRWMKVASDELGNYRAVFWKSARVVARVTIAEGERPPYFDPLVDIDDGAVIDFHLPRNEITVHVAEMRTAHAIPGAAVSLFSEFENGDVGKVSTSNGYVTDDSGTAVLPPVRAGRVTLRASATGFLASKPESFDIDDTTLDRDVTIELTRADAVQTRVLLPGGEPAAGAEAELVDEFLNGQIVWHGAADPDGTLVVLTRNRAGLLLIRHPSAASCAQRVAALGDAIRLQPAAAGRLRIRSTTASHEPVPFALITVWLDGIRLTDTAAAFVAWAPMGLTAHDGTWSADRLPPGIRILATRHLAPAQLVTGAYDSLATVLPYPWPGELLDLPCVQ